MFIGNHLQVGTIGELPSPRLGAATAITSDGTVYLFGGAESPNATIASPEILSMAPLDSDWEFDRVGEMTQVDGTSMPLTGAKATVLTIDGKKVRHRWYRYLQTLALSKPANFLFDPEIDQIVWHPTLDKQTVFQ